MNPYKPPPPDPSAKGDDTFYVVIVLWVAWFAVKGLVEWLN